MLKIGNQIDFQYRIADTGGVYAVLVDYNRYIETRIDNDIKVIAISKCTVGPRFNGDMNDFILEMKVFVNAVNQPTIDLSKYSHKDCFLINDWAEEMWTDDHTEEVCRNWLKYNR